MFEVWSDKCAACSINVFRISDYLLIGAESFKNSMQELQYWKNCSLIKVLEFLKDVWNVEIFDKEPKKVKSFFSIYFLLSHFVLELFPQIW